MDLHELRVEKKLTMRCVSETAGISEPYYCLIEGGKRRPSVEIAKRLGAALGVNWTLFFEDSASQEARLPPD